MALCAPTLAAAFLAPLLHVAPNRLVTGDPIFADTVLGEFGWIFAGLIAAGGLLTVGAGRYASMAATLCFAAALLLFAAAIGSAAQDLVAYRPVAVRVRPAWGALVCFGSIANALMVAVRCWRKRPRSLLLAAIAASLMVLALNGTFDSLSLVIEFRARRHDLVDATAEHVALSAAALLLGAIAVGILFMSQRTRGLVEHGIAGLQVVPAVALLGALVALISALLAAAPVLRDLGLTALGATPAVCGIATYLLLPLWRGLRQALEAADPSTIEAAAALGMSRHQTLTQIRLPLGSSVLIGALRIAAVQSIGLTTLAALVGAGGLGRLVFDGMAQFAPDLILLGALPIVILSLSIDRALSWIESKLSPD